MAGLAGLVLIAGCSAGGSDEQASGHAPRAVRTAPAVASVPRLVSAADKRLPVEEFLLSNVQRDRLDGARTVLVERCMARFGFAYRAPAAPKVFRPRTLTQLRYGITDAAAAARRGYTPVGAVRGQPGRRPAESLTARESLVLNGTDDPAVKPGSAHADSGARVNGRAVPVGGCHGEALRALHADNPQAGGDAPIADRINMETFAASRRDGRVTTAYARWSACMKAHGHRYARPEEAASDPAWRTRTASARERAVATADARCKAQVDLVGIWYAVEVAYQRQAVEQNADRLARVRADLRLRQRLAGTVLNEHRRASRTALVPGPPDALAGESRNGSHHPTLPRN
ncbi:hypothetical protein FRZ03_37680 [Streptomyces misionensis]|uniref:Uncharacterized protein n=1 Tax=Streptomyces misionensis TaxID=67331 RepID=A0A5C6IKF5_9ACTN|nr:hypothetical protein [Streptomyces misionensis]TWV29530.1 hypothetical protein FRZ03_37680 [Streptomyces misionensis]